MIPFPDKKYDIIYADPPWFYNDKGSGKRPNGSLSGSFAAEAGRYNTLKTKEIKSLPVKSISKRNCILLLWTTSPFLPEAIDIIKCWGFKYKTVGFCWSKITTSGKEVSNLGQYTLGNIELCLLATKGRPLIRVNRTIRQLVKDIRTIHSKKPDEVRRRIEVLFGSVDRIELFARNKFSGWDCWGNEVQCSI